MASDRDDRLPPWLLWSERPFPSAKTLCHPVVVDGHQYPPKSDVSIMPSDAVRAPAFSSQSRSSRDFKASTNRVCHGDSNEPAHTAGSRA
jgi:hypothetical protein